MPEGHAIHRLAGTLDRAFAGSVIASTSPQGRFDAGAARLDGARWQHADAVGKHLLVAFADREQLAHVHLGIYGSWRITPVVGLAPVGLVRWRVTTATHTADLRGAATCELLLPDEVDALIARLGPDPLRPDADPDRAWQKIVSSRAPIATLLMDQKVLSGVGNIYRAEVLFRHRLDPLLPGSRLTREQWLALWDDLVMLMSRGVATGRIDTVRPEHEPEAMGRPPRVDDHGGEVYVYRRAAMPCLVCGTPVSTAEHAGRNLFWCASCQARR